MPKCNFFQIIAKLSLLPWCIDNSSIPFRNNHNESLSEDQWMHEIKLTTKNPAISSNKTQSNAQPHANALIQIFTRAHSSTTRTSKQESLLPEHIHTFSPLFHTDPNIVYYSVVCDVGPLVLITIWISISRVRNRHKTLRQLMAVKQWKHTANTAAFFPCTQYSLTASLRLSAYDFLVYSVLRSTK